MFSFDLKRVNVRWSVDEYFSFKTRIGEVATYVLSAILLSRNKTKVIILRSVDVDRFVILRRKTYFITKLLLG